MTARAIDPNRIALIGFGEVGQRFGREFLETGKFSVSTYDILFNNSPAGAALREKARTLKVEACASAASAAEGARIVFSCVTATAAKDVAEEAGAYLGPGQFFVDINSVSPETKRADADAVARSGANYVECAVMAPVAPYGIKVPILLGGKHGQALAAILNPAGMKMEMASEVVGQASAIKMCRSIIIKGIEALAVECFLTSRRYGGRGDHHRLARRNLPADGLGKARRLSDRPRRAARKTARRRDARGCRDRDRDRPRAADGLGDGVAPGLARRRGGGRARAQGIGRRAMARNPGHSDRTVEGEGAGRALSRALSARGSS
jgi:3-hydroxyisobutyrate dehydrogenase-like beta-hydroxyacid dehydrogenase